MNEGTVVAEFDKNSREKVRVSLTEYNGVDLLDVRAFYQSGDEMRPGKGIALRRELIAPLRKALQAAEKALAAEKAVKAGKGIADEDQAGEGKENDGLIHEA